LRSGSSQLAVRKSRSGSAGRSGNLTGFASHPASSRQDLRLRAIVRISPRRHRQQGFRVRVLRVPDDLLRLAPLHDSAEIHHGDPIRDARSGSRDRA
jgi:hypothetical protein